MGFVYFIECDGKIKIGYSANVSSRMKSLKTGAPAELNLLAEIPGSTKFERAIHVKLKQHRLSGEWFSDCVEVRELMGALIERGPDAIGFVETHRSETSRRDPQVRVPQSSEIAQRLNACVSRYIGDMVQDAYAASPLLADSIVGGRFTKDRGLSAAGLIRAATDDVEHQLDGSDRSIAICLARVAQLENTLHELFQ